MTFKISKVNHLLIFEASGTSLNPCDIDSINKLTLPKNILYELLYKRKTVVVNI